MITIDPIAHLVTIFTSAFNLFDKTGLVASWEELDTDRTVDTRLFRLCCGSFDGRRPQGIRLCYSQFAVLENEFFCLKNRIFIAMMLGKFFSYDKYDNWERAGFF